MHPAPDALTLEVLGQPQLSQGGRPVACGSKKAFALFVYLVLTGRRHSRSALAALFWGGDPEAGRTSLRTALQRLPAALSAWVDAQRDSIALAPGAPILVDAARFAALASDDGVAGLETASQLYRGELLKGFDADAAPEFDDWLLAERTRYRQLAQSVFDRLIGRHRDAALQDSASAAGARASALATARRWLDVEPATETAHRWLMQLLIESGQPEAARAQYELCRRALAVAFGRAPSPETRALIDGLGSPGEAAGRSAPPSHDNLQAAAVPSTPFVGRIEDLAALDALLADPSCRLLTLHGMGGSGKTRLAHVVAQQVLPRFAQGATWVALETAGDADAAAAAIARALGIEAAAARQGARAAICTALQRQQRLLILDNAEHLLGADGQPDAFVDLLLSLVAAAPGVRVLVTSRDVLGVAEEWVYEVQGLPLPVTGDVATVAQGAAELFVQRARQAYLGFSPSAEWPHIERICRLVGGLPLAIELAAAWVRTIPCGEIAAQLGAEADALQSAHKGRPARQRSLDAVVSYSWNLLDDSLRTDLASLSVFASGFTHEAARAVADATLRQVSVLIDKSLVQRRVDGRLALHPVVRRFAAARLRERDDRGDEVVRRHAAWFADVLQRCRSRLDGPDEIGAEDQLNVERAEILRAAEHWLGRAEPSALDAVAEPLLRLLLARSAFREADALATRLLALGALGASARATTMAMQARALTLLGRREDAAKLFDAAARYADEHGFPHVAAYANLYAVALPYEAGDLAGALSRLDAMEREAADWPADLRMRLAYSRGLMHDAAGALDAAESALRASLAYAQSLSAPVATATAESSLATVLLRRRQMDTALPMLRSALAVFERIGRLHDVARLCNVLAVAALWTDDPRTAEVSARRSLRLFQEIGYRAGESSAADTLGQALLRQGRIEEARPQFRHAIDVVEGTPMTFEPRCHLVEACLRVGERGEALRVLGRMAEDLDAREELPAAARYTLLAAAHCAAGIDSERARAWAAALLADPELDADLRAAAEALSGGASAREARRVAWSEFSEDVSRLLRAARSSGR